jgi:hypothetical protein
MTETIISITSEQWIAIATCNVLFYFAWAVGVQIKKNSEIKEDTLTGTELYHDWLPKNK